MAVDSQNWDSAADTAAAAGPTACICKCSIQGGYDFNHGYYEPPATGGCKDLNGQACVYKGRIGELSECQSAPRPIPTSDSLVSEEQSLSDFLRWLAELPNEED